METALLMCDVTNIEGQEGKQVSQTREWRYSSFYALVLAKDTPQIAAREEDRAAPIVALQAWLFTEMRSDSVDDYIRTD